MFHFHSSMVVYPIIDGHVLTKHDKIVKMGLMDKNVMLDMWAWGEAIN